MIQLRDISSIDHIEYSTGSGESELLTPEDLVPESCVMRHASIPGTLTHSPPLCNR